MSLITRNGKLLLRNGKLTTSRDCCCGGCPTGDLGFGFYLSDEDGNEIGNAGCTGVHILPYQGVVDGIGLWGYNCGECDTPPFSDLPQYLDGSMFLWPCGQASGDNFISIRFTCDGTKTGCDRYTLHLIEDSNVGTNRWRVLNGGTDFDATFFACNAAGGIIVRTMPVYTTMFGLIAFYVM